MKLKASLRCFIVPAAITLFSLPSVWAAGGDWNVDAAGDWSLDSNWNPVAVPGTTAGDVVGLSNNITAARIVTIDTTPRTAGTLNIGDSDNTHAFTLAASGGGTLTFDNSGSEASLNELGSITDVISAPMILNDNLAISVPGSLTLSGAISESGGAKSITKSGGGTLRLNAANSYTGSTIVNEGILSIGNLGGLGNTSAITLAGGTRIVATVDLLTINAPITLGDAGTTSTITAPAFGSDGADVHTTTLAGAISGDGNVTFLSTQGNNVYSTVVLNAASTYTGTTLMNTDATNSNKNIFLRLGVDDALPTTTVLTMDGNTGTGSAPGRQCALNLNGKNQTLAGLTNIARNLRLQRVYSSAAAILTINDSGNRTFSGQIGNGGTNITVVKEGVGIWTLSGSNSHVGPTTINGGAINIRSANALGNASQGTLVSNGTALQIQGGITVASEALALNGTGINSDGALRSISGINTYNGAITLGSDSQIQSDAGTLNLGGGISGTGFGLTVSGAGATTIATTSINTGDGGSLTKANGGTLTLNATSDYTGLTTINGGAVVVQNSNALGTSDGGTVVNGSGSGGSSNARLDISGGTTVIGESVTINGAGNFIGALTSGSGNNVWAGPVTIGSAGTRIGAFTGASLEISGVIDSGANPHGLVIRTTDLTGSVILSGANTYLGNTQVLIGKLQLAGDDNRLPIGTTLFLSSSGTNPDAELDLNGTNQEVAGLSLTGGALKNSINNSSETLSTLTVNNAATSTFNGILKGNLALAKTGTNTLNLGGVNTYAGATTVSAGKLFVNGDQSAASGAIGVAADATLGGTGIIGGDVNVANNGILEFDLSTPAAGHDKLELATDKALNFSGASTLTLTSIEGASPGLYTLVSAPGGITGSVPTNVILPAGWTADPPAISGGTDLVINITSTGGAGVNYASWSGGAAADGDSNNDGVPNAIAWALGAADVNANAIGLLPDFDNSSDPTYAVFTFQRSEDAEADPGTTIQVEYGNNLTGWTPAVNDGDNVIIQVDDQSPNDLVTVKLKRSILSSGGKLFARLKVVITP